MRYSPLRLESYGGFAADAVRHDLRTIVVRTLISAGFERLADVARLTEAELAGYPNFGRKAVNEIKDALARDGLSLKPENAIPPEEMAAKLLGRLHATKAAFEKAQRDLDKFLASLSGLE